ncbi:FHA domain-containing protein [Bifidobacterium sp. UTBIF-78]|uniref:FHA domain-containing protein n=1 Tax=Bifidobacterium sp. UTBIF-78 TaxID=1465263 RepID=UPI0015E2F25D|nr:FHA domain-containing protein [Bifidobacterium sp. UTBIF-78]TPF92981.1 signal peptide protein [Bifidobacterium sp. UTBIF-78]
MAFIPYPPAPEFGWYEDDRSTVDSVADVPESSTASVTPAAPESSTVSGSAAPATSESSAAASASESSAAPSSSAISTAPEPSSAPESGPAHADITPHAAEDDISDWDSTVLSSAFTSKAPQKTYLLHNDVTGQTIVIDKSTLLGRKPSMDVPQGAKAERVEDPTRTTSRNHAAISIDTDGALWIEDYGSLNGTYIIQDGQETQVVKGTPRQLEAPSTVRIGDQFFHFTEQAER